MNYSLSNPQNNRSLTQKAVKLWWWLITFTVIVAAYTLYAHPDYVVGGLPAKNDAIVLPAQACTGPGQFVRGYDRETGEAVCGQVTGCPYADSVPLGPECDKLAPQQQLAQPIEVPAMQEFQGK